MKELIFKNLNGRYIKYVSRKELKTNIEVIKSLKKYDEGKKTISTINIERSLPNIRVAQRG